MSGGDRPGHVIDVQLLGLNNCAWSPPLPLRVCESERGGKIFRLLLCCWSQVAGRDPSFDAPYSYTL